MTGHSILIPKKFNDNLMAQIKEWIHVDKEILLGMHANEDMDNPCSKIALLLTNMGLIDLHCALPPSKLQTSHSSMWKFTY